MPIEIHDRPIYSSKEIGNKAKNLMILHDKGFSVPGGIILPVDIYDAWMENTGLSSSIPSILDHLNDKNIKSKSRQILQRFDLYLSLQESKKKQVSKEEGGKARGTSGSVFADPFWDFLSDRLDFQKKYAVRSSSTLEDGDRFSFAGLYESYLDQVGPEEISQAVVKCFRSLFSERSLQYMVNHRIDCREMKMAVVIQEMVAADYSGIAFTVDPVRGQDRKILIELAEGRGDRLVGGFVKPYSFSYDWPLQEAWPRIDQFVPGQINHLGELFLQVQEAFGYPCDIEFALREGKIFLLQARAITKISYQSFRDDWSTADFRDGGVSAATCLPFMWSLYEYIWNFALVDFITESKILTREECDHVPGDVFFGRPYWNMSLVKKAMSQIPGYKERDFDAEFGVTSNYEGDGDTTGLSMGTILKAIPIFLAQKKMLKTWQEKREEIKKTILSRYNRYLSGIQGWERKAVGEIDRKIFEEEWMTLTREDYFFSETSYFRQIFLNTVHQTLLKEDILKHLSYEDYLGLLNGIEDISHLRPFHFLELGVADLASDEEKRSFWMNDSSEDLFTAYRENPDREEFAILQEFLLDFGYHSDKELDVAYPCYQEDPLPVIRLIRDMLEELLEEKAMTKEVAGEPADSRQSQKGQSLTYAKRLKKLEAGLPKRTFRKIKASTDQVRTMLWWREELRDLSSRMYYVIRLFSKKLGEIYERDGILDRADDIWYCRLDELWAFQEGRLTVSQFRAETALNTRYYRSFRNFLSENEIGPSLQKLASPVEDAEGGDGRVVRLRGVGCNGGTVRARARVVRSLDDMDRLQKGDILVTKFTDTGWTPRFAGLSGVVTEFGGVLCHAAIVAREYGIPCIAGLDGAMDRIPDGAVITINGGSGYVYWKVE